MKLFNIDIMICDDNGIVSADSVNIVSDAIQNAAYYSRGLLKDMCLGLEVDINIVISDTYDNIFKLKYYDRNEYNYMIAITPYTINSSISDDINCVGELFHVYFKDIKSDPILERYEILTNKDMIPNTINVRRNKGDLSKTNLYNKNDEVYYREATKTFKIESVYMDDDTDNMYKGLLYDIYNDNLYLDMVHETDLKLCDNTQKGDLKWLKKK